MSDPHGEEGGEGAPLDTLSRLNLSTILSHDSSVERIISSAVQVAMYVYSHSKCSWEKHNVQGSFFIYKRKCSPIYGFIILNRLSTYNCVQLLSANLEFDLKSPFILYKVQNNIFGIWFYSENECKKCYDLMSLYVRQERNRHTNSPFKVNEEFDTDANSVKSRDVITVKDLFAKATLIQSKAKENLKPTPTINGVFLEKSMQERSLVESDQSHLIAPEKLSTLNSVPNKTVQDNENLLIPSKSSIDTPRPSRITSSAAVSANTVVPISHNVDNATGATSVKQISLMSPHMFTSARAEDARAPPPTDSTAEESGHPSSSSSSSAPAAAAVSALTRSQFLQALTYLLTNDTEFVSKLHDAYVNSISDMISGKPAPKNQ